MCRSGGIAVIYPELFVFVFVFGSFRLLNGSGYSG